MVTFGFLEGLTAVQVPDSLLFPAFALSQTNCLGLFFHGIFRRHGLKCRGSTQTQ